VLGTIARWFVAKGTTSQFGLTYLLRISEWFYRKAVHAAPCWIDARRELVGIILFQGKRKEAIEESEIEKQFQHKVAIHLGLPVDAKVFLPSAAAKIIGGMGHIDAYIKYRILTGDVRQYWLLAREIANKPFLDYWRDYITIVTEPRALAELRNQELAYGVCGFSAMPALDGHLTHIHTAISQIQRRWRGEHRPPLLVLKNEHAVMMAEQKKAWGMKPSDWFICLHVRSSGYHAQARHGVESLRNASIETYDEMIHAVIAQEGWVVRVGDSTMPPMSFHNPRLIDYARSPIKSPDMDVALAASCKLFVGQSSGLHSIPHAFGVPCCLVNLPINLGFPWHAEDIVLYKHYYSEKLEHYLTYEEVLASPICEADNQYLLNKHKVRLMPNSPGEITKVVLDALKQVALAA